MWVTNEGEFGAGLAGVFVTVLDFCVFGCVDVAGGDTESEVAGIVVNMRNGVLLKLVRGVLQCKGKFTNLEVLGKVLPLKYHDASMIQWHDNLRRGGWTVIEGHLIICIVDTHTGLYQFLRLGKVLPVVRSFDNLAEI